MSERSAMEKSGKNSKSSMWFNVHLFIINGAPLKFYLAGFSQIEFHEMANIIKAYGGHLSKPDASDTVIFCESNDPVEAAKDDRYDIQYFYDSIIALQPQNLTNYKLKVSPAKKSNRLVHDNQSPKLENREENRNKLKESFNCGLQGAINQRSTISKDNTLTHSHRNVIHRENTCQSSLDEAADSDESEVSHHNDHSKHVSNDESTAPSLPHSLTTESVNKKPGNKNKKKEISFTEEDNQIIIQWLIETNAMPRHHSKQIWMEFLDEKVLANCSATAWQLKKHFIKELTRHPTFVKYIEDAKASGHVSKPENNTLRYTEKENRVIIQYLIDNDAISRARATPVWIECLSACKSSLKPFRRAYGLKSHFTKSLRYNYGKYTDDPEALRKFREMTSVKHPKSQHFERIDLD